MREDILSYIKTLSLGSFTVSDELPRDDSGMALYLKNPKKLYVDIGQVEATPLIQTLSGFDVHTESTTVSVYFTADAKTLPANYSSLTQSLRLGKDIQQAKGFNNRSVDVQTEYDADMLITRIDYTFSKIT
jgi:hypothetical protein|tara:strand:+ start:528 stop:920 length:393 start_codon:yes stop_codon:yes gene_type:complete